MANVVVVGAQWGDEGKGKVVDIYTEFADDVTFSGMEHPGGDKMEDYLVAPHHEGVPCVVPTLVADHVVGKFGVDVNHLPLALITPLGANHNHVSHYCLLVRIRMSGSPSP